MKQFQSKKEQKMQWSFSMNKVERAIIFDSGTIINFTINGLLYILEDLKKIFKGKFLITQEVLNEIVNRPMKVQRFELGAIRAKHLVDEKILELPESIEIDSKSLKNETQKFMQIANKALKQGNQWVEIVSEAEISCLALSEELTRKGIKNIIAIDERTTRTIAEKPEKLEEIISKKIHSKVKLENPEIKIFKHFRFIRSSELVFVAYKKGLFHIKDKKMLEAALYATKFKGCSISFEEIKELKNM